MYNPTMRLLTILELLQSRAEVSGQELAEKLEVEERSIRRYIMMLRDLGIPIEGERGRYGGYSLRPGFRLPPLMFNKDEITAVMMGLMLVQELGADANLAVESAIAKIQRVLPDELRASTVALANSLILDDVSDGMDAIPNDELALFSTSVDNNTCVRIHYESREGEDTERTIAPYGVVLHARKWYIPAYCYLRKDIRVFRMDRIVEASPTKQHFTKPVDFDPRSYVLQSIARTSGNYAFEVLFDAPLEMMNEIIPPTMAVLEASGFETLMRCYSDDPFWFARYLVQVEVPFTVLKTDELRDALHTLSDDILASIWKDEDNEE
jgi:predicted DNA-binding transcriptional regulator YafY